MKVSEKNAQISLMILTEFNKTGSLKTAYNNILGAGAYEKLASEVYDAIKQK